MSRFDNDKLRALRLERGETLEVVADAIGVTKSALSQIEAGASEPRLNTILKLSGHFEKPLVFFVTEGETTIAAAKAASEKL